MAPSARTCGRRVNAQLLLLLSALFFGSCTGLREREAGLFDWRQRTVATGALSAVALRPSSGSSSDESLILLASRGALSAVHATSGQLMWKQPLNLPDRQSVQLVVRGPAVLSLVFPDDGDSRTPVLLRMWGADSGKLFWEGQGPVSGGVPGSVGAMLLPGTPERPGGLVVSWSSIGMQARSMRNGKLEWSVEFSGELGKLGWPESYLEDHSIIPGSVAVQHVKSSEEGAGIGLLNVFFLSGIAGKGAGKLHCLKYEIASGSLWLPPRLGASSAHPQRLASALSSVSLVDCHIPQEAAQSTAFCISEDSRSFLVFWDVQVVEEALGVLLSKHIDSWDGGVSDRSVGCRTVDLGRGLDSGCAVACDGISHGSVVSSHVLLLSFSAVTRRVGVLGEVTVPELVPSELAMLSLSVTQQNSQLLLHVSSDFPAPLCRVLCTSEEGGPRWSVIEAADAERELFGISEGAVMGRPVAAFAVSGPELKGQSHNVYVLVQTEDLSLWTFALRGCSRPQPRAVPLWSCANVFSAVEFLSYASTPYENRRKYPGLWSQESCDSLSWSFVSTAVGQEELADRIAPLSLVRRASMWASGARALASHVFAHGRMPAGQSTVERSRLRRAHAIASQFGMEPGVLVFCARSADRSVESGTDKSLQLKSGRTLKLLPAGSRSQARVLAAVDTGTGDVLWSYHVPTLLRRLNVFRLLSHAPESLALDGDEVRLLQPAELGLAIGRLPSGSLVAGAFPVFAVVGIIEVGVTANASHRYSAAFVLFLDGVSGRVLDLSVVEPTVDDEAKSVEEPWLVQMWWPCSPRASHTDLLSVCLWTSANSVHVIALGSSNPKERSKMDAVPSRDREEFLQLFRHPDGELLGYSLNWSTGRSYAASSLKPDSGAWLSPVAGRVDSKSIHVALTEQLWSLSFGRSIVEAIAFASPAGGGIAEDVASRQARPRLGGGVEYKYLNPHLVVVAWRPQGPDQLRLDFVDGVTGSIVVSVLRSDTVGPTLLALSESSLYYAVKNTAENVHELGVIDLFLEKSGRHAMHGGQDGKKVKPYALTHAYALETAPSFLVPTVTRLGVSRKQLLVGFQYGSIVALDSRVLDARRPPRSAGLTLAERQAEIMPYAPTIPVLPMATLTYNQTVWGLYGVATFPSPIESTSYVVGVGEGEMFFAEFSPSRAFDTLGLDFSAKKPLLLLGIALLAALWVFLKRSVRRKKLHKRWQ